MCQLLPWRKKIYLEHGAASDAGKAAAAVLDSLSGETALILALLADCGAEALAVVRFFDRENFDFTSTEHELRPAFNVAESQILFLCFAILAWVLELPCYSQSEVKP